MSKKANSFFGMMVKMTDDGRFEEVEDEFLPALFSVIITAVRL